jgi:hypothetical protein
MGTVFEQYPIEEQCSVVRFLWAKALNEKNIHKEMFPVYGGKCLSRKAVHNCVKKFSRGRSKIADDTLTVADVVETAAKRLLCCGFRRTSKAMGQVYQCWRICRGIHVFSMFEYHMIYVLYPFVTYLLSLVFRLSHDHFLRKYFPIHYPSLLLRFDDIQSSYRQCSFQNFFRHLQGFTLLPSLIKYYEVKLFKTFR